MLFLIVIFLSIVRPCYQVTYPCNPNAACGCSVNPVSISRIVGGESAGPATWSWAVSISIDGTYQCGGSIISSSWVITAAHCVNDYALSQITIHAGSIRPQFSPQRRIASRIIVHPLYIAATYENDIALLRLSSPLTMNDPNVAAICIPSVQPAPLSANEWPAPGTTVVAIGWGRLSDNGPVPATLQQVTISTVDYRSKTCSIVLYNAKVQFCAGVFGGGKDTCQGDSGGPLMMFTASRQWVLVGLTSFGEGCAQPQLSGVYTRVAVYESWIRFHTNSSYSPLVLSHTIKNQASRCYLLLLLLLSFFVKYHL